MTAYIIRRLLLAIPTVLGTTLIIFTIMRVMPGDVVDTIIGDEVVATEAQKDRIREDLGLSDPLPVQYLTWLSGVVTLDFGDSLWTRRPILDDVARRLVPTLQIAVGALIVSLLVAIPAGAVSAIRQGSIVDYAVRGFAIAGLAIPNFWIATMALLLSNLYFGWIPPIAYRDFWTDPSQNMQQLLGPMLILGYALAAPVARMTRSAVLEVLREDYIRTARAKGLRQSNVLFRHGLKNALLPIITISATQVGFLISGSVIMETIFVVPGLGKFVVDSIHGRDYPVVQLLVTFMAVGYVFINLLTDLSYAWLDPRIRYS
jgi:peptide/nickel transport system permease protein